MESYTVIFIICGLVYSVALLVVGSLVYEDIILSPRSKFWLIVLAVVLPILGLIISYSKTHNWSKSKNNNDGGSNSIIGDTTSSSDCGCGGD